MDAEALWQQIRSRHPGVWQALLADAEVTARYRGERHKFGSKLDAVGQMLRLAWASDAFLAQVLYRLKARLQALGIPILPRLAHRLAMVVAQVSIGDPVVVEPGIYILHGQVVIDGLVEVGAGTTIGPFVTVGLRAGEYRGPTIGREVSIGTGAKIIGPVHIGDGAQIGAGAVVVDNVKPGATVAGIPARETQSVLTARPEERGAA